MSKAFIHRSYHENIYTEGCEERMARSNNSVVSDHQHPQEYLGLQVGALLLTLSQPIVITE